MTFDDILAQVITLLKRQGRVSYRALKRRFDLSDEYIDDLKEEILYVHESSVAADERGFTWTGETEDIQVTASPPDQAEPQPVIELDQPTQIASPPPEPHTPDAERRQLTILFTDLVDSTKLSSQLDAEDYREIVRAYQAACAEVIERFECHLAQTLGDGLLIYSGYPVAHENDAERAVRTGLGILDAMKTLNERLEQEKDIRLGVRVGIHTGSVVVGDVGAGSKQEQLALGEVPNIAARIQALAYPDTVIISAATYQLVEGYFDSETLGERELRGVDQPIPVYRVLRESGVQNRLDVASTRGLTPLVGREQEVGLLLDRWSQTKDGQGQVVLLSGEGGIGKSRLVQVLKDHVADEPHIRLECRSSPYFTNTALYPIVDFIQRTLQFQADDTPERRLEKLEQELSQYQLPLAETVPLFAGLLSLSLSEDQYPPLNWTPQRQRQKTLETIVAMLLERAEKRPVLFIIEDLHFTDPSTLELLNLLIDQTPTAAICVLLTCRPEFQPTWSHRSYVTEMTLNRLSREQIERLAEHVADGKRLPAEVLEQITEKTDGVPLFVEEMTKAVLETGALKDVDGRYELIGTVGSLSIPSTLQDSLMARLDRLMTAKVVAQLGAVMGRQFSYELLQAVSQLDEAMLQHELNRLIEAELLYQRGLPPQATYTFKHALVVTTAYESLLRSTRQGYHRRIAEVLAEQFPDTQPELLAHHCTEARLIEQAVGYWYQAGKRALQGSANQEAISHLTTGLNLLATLPEMVERAERELDFQMVLGPALMAAKGFGSPEAEQAYTRARALCQQVKGTPQLFPALWGLYTFYHTRGVVQTARELGEQLFTLAQLHQNSASLPTAHFALGQALFRMGAFAPARMHLEKGITLLHPQQERALAVRYGTALGVMCRSVGGLVLWALGYPDTALRWCREACALAQDLAHPYSLAYAQPYLVQIHMLRGEGQAASEQVEALMRLATQQNFAQRLAFGISLRGWVLAVQGQVEAGLVQMRQGLIDMQFRGSKVSEPRDLSLIAEAYGNIGQVNQGLDLMADAQAVVDENGLRYYEAQCYRLKGALLLQHSSDNTAEAEACFHQAISVAQSQSAKSLELRAATSLAKLWQSQDKRKEAYDLLEPVYGWFTEGFDTADLIDAKALLDALSEAQS
jgi:class 3 adenylate cyclase/predicted ATPase